MHEGDRGMRDTWNAPRRIWTTLCICMGALERVRTHKQMKLIDDDAHTRYRGMGIFMAAGRRVIGKGWRRWREREREFARATRLGRLGGECLWDIVQSRVCLRFVGAGQEISESVRAAAKLFMSGSVIVIRYMELLAVAKRGMYFLNIKYS